MWIISLLIDHASVTRLLSNHLLQLNADFGLKHAVDCQVSISNSDLHKAHYVCQTKFSAFCVFIIAYQQKLSDENKLLNLILTQFLLVNSDHNKRRLKCLAVNFSPFRFSLAVRTRPKLQS